MLNTGFKKNGFTLIEVLVVIVIMGTLTSMGVVSLQNAVKKNESRDYAMNMAAFLERMANDANRMSRTLYVDANSYTIMVDTICCDQMTTDNENLYARFDLNLSIKFGCNNNRIGCTATDYRDGIADMCDDGESGDDWYASDSTRFRPRIGLSAAPTRGFLCFEYGNSCIFGGVVKCANSNTIIPISHSGPSESGSSGGWQKL